MQTASALRDPTAPKPAKNPSGPIGLGADQRSVQPVNPDRWCYHQPPADNRELSPSVLSGRPRRRKTDLTDFQIFCLVAGYVVFAAIVVFFGPAAMELARVSAIPDLGSAGLLDGAAERLGFSYVQAWPLAFLMMIVAGLALLVRIRH